MVKKSQGLPLNTVALAIIALLVIIFLVLIFTGGLGKFSSGVSKTGVSSKEVTAGQCSEYASTIQSSLISTTSSSVQLSLIASSQYVTSNCSFIYPYTFTLSNGSEVVCDGNANNEPQICMCSSSAKGPACPSTYIGPSSCPSGETLIATGCYLT
ncbi:hypothetical protein YN1_6060 [Nanoarchaeota archaeon]